MKLKNILCGILVCGAFCACSDQEPENSNKPGSFDGKAYLRVNITDANSTRATGGDLEYGDATEHEVGNADFFFYDTNGIFIARANVWDSGTENEDNPAGNIEFFGKSVIVLKGLTETNHPKHLVTVLNTPEDFEPANTLDEMKTLLAGSIYNGSHFTMSTTSYGGGSLLRDGGERIGLQEGAGRGAERNARRHLRGASGGESHPARGQR